MNGYTAASSVSIKSKGIIGGDDTTIYIFDNLGRENAQITESNYISRTHTFNLLQSL